MDIKITNDSVFVDGREYVAKSSLPDVKVGRQWIASYLGVTPQALYKTPWNFPDWGKALETEKTPYTEKEMVKFLAIPINRRKERYYLTHEDNS